MPLGFLLGGLFPMGADPGLGIVLVPVGGIFLFAGVLIAARIATAPDVHAAPAEPKPPVPKPAAAKGR